MSRRPIFVCAVTVLMSGYASAQPALTQQVPPAAPQQWQSPAALGNGLNVNGATATNMTAAQATLGQQVTPAQFSGGNSGGRELPREHGQVWQVYDISPYTTRITSTATPEQAIVDWILRETGTEVWFSEPTALLSASKNSLRVYHTPQMQKIVKETVDRFVRTMAQSHVIGLRLVTVGSPNWRSTAYDLLRAVPVQTPGLEAWLVSKENAALLLGQLKKRNDFREHNSPNLAIHNGQSYTLAQRRPRSFPRSVRPASGSSSGYDLVMGQIDEGFSLQMSPLFSLDGRIIDAVIKCHVDQVEKFVSIPIDAPTPRSQPRQRVQIQIPQLVSWRLHERFRWPAGDVLLLSCGVVATPDTEQAGALGLPPIRPLMNNDPGRADALLFIESKGTTEHMLIDARSAGRTNYQGRY